MKPFVVPQYNDHNKIKDIIHIICNTYLTGHRDLRGILVPERAPAPVRIIKHDGHRGLGDPSLALLVHELLEVRGPNLLQVRDAQDEAYGVEDVRLTRPVQPRDGVEERIEAVDHGPRRVRLEPFQGYLFDVHFEFDSRIEVIE